MVVNIFNINMNMFDFHQVTYEIYIEDKLVQKQQMQAPKEILIMNFMQTAEQIGNDRKAMKIKMISPTTIWDDFENKEKVLENEVVFSNNAMIAFEENKEQGEK